MFNVGDKVRNVAANVVGIVVEVDGDRVYFEQDNGAEVDFPAASLVLETDFQTSHADPLPGDAAAPDADEGACAAVLAELYPAVAEIGEAAYAGVKRVPGVVVKGWPSLSAAQKLGIIATATGVPAADWIEAARPGGRTKIGPLQLSVLAARAGKK
tara:strand:- start:648 stop:1115 length:468 start_codon:yes stop_codon:yes gene_type:complete